MGKNIDGTLIRDFVLYTLRRLNDRFIDEFLEASFDEGLREGLWLFLFDSFDEIPDVLSSTESDRIVLAYSNAISDFLAGMNACRGIIASRAYRGPAAQDWVTFRVLQLSSKRQRDLIDRSLINNHKAAVEVEAGLLSATDDVRLMARNPMLLGLLCEHVKLEAAFPDTAFQVFSHYIEYRFCRDADRVSSRFNLSIAQLKEYAELAAFSMTADATIGLTPKILEIGKSPSLANFNVNAETLTTALNALSYMRLGRLSGEGDLNTREFTFSHRRFQEYLATQIVLRNNEIVEPQALLLDGRWRETTVVILQTSDRSIVNRVYTEAYIQLSQAIFRAKDQDFLFKSSYLNRFGWADGELHILGIIQAGRSDKNQELPEALRILINDRLKLASTNTNFLDQKLSLEVAGAGDNQNLIDMMQRSLQSQSRWISDIVYRQAARLAHPVESVYAAIRKYLVRLVLEKRIEGEYRATQAFIARLPASQQLAGSLKFARILPVIDRWMFCILMAFLIYNDQTSINIYIGLAVLSVVISLFPTSTILACSGSLVAKMILSLAAITRWNREFYNLPLAGQVVHVAGGLLIFYSAPLLFAGIYCLYKNKIARWYLAPVAGITATALVLKELAQQPKRLAILAINVVLLFGSFPIFALLISYFSLDYIMSIVAPIISFGAVAALMVGLLIIFVAELAVYRRWSASASPFSPQSFVSFFQEAKTSILHNHMLDKLKPSLGSNKEDWKIVLSSLIERYTVEYDRNHLGSACGAGGSSAPTSFKNTAKYSVIISLPMRIIGREFAAKRRDNLYICLEKVCR